MRPSTAVGQHSNGSRNDSSLFVCVCVCVSVFWSSNGACVSLLVPFFRVFLRPQKEPLAIEHESLD